LPQGSARPWPPAWAGEQGSGTKSPSLAPFRRTYGHRIRVKEVVSKTDPQAGTLGTLAAVTS
jgi:hypothetical protein